MPKLTNINGHTNLDNISHKNVQYVDDSTNIISSSNTNDIQLYINLYFSILKQFYNINKLLNNANKSKLLVITKPNLRQFTTNIKLQANKYLIEQSIKIKILCNLYCKISCKSTDYAIAVGQSDKSKSNISFDCWIRSSVTVPNL